MRRLGIGLVALALAMVPAMAAFGQSGKASVSVLHGIPGEGGFPVDIYVNGDYSAPFLADFTFGTLAGPVELDPGVYSIEIYGADADPETTDPALAFDTPSVAAGGSYTLVAHLTEAGAPAAAAFVNDTSTLEAGKARVAVRHLAAAPAVNVQLADGTDVFTNLSNPNEAKADVDAGTLTVQVVATADESIVALEPTALNLADGTLTIVHAIGDFAGGSFTVVPQVISGLGAAPEGVPTGDSGLATDGLPVALVAVMGAAALAVAASGAKLARKRG
jgi:hypothetical protein